MSSVIGGSCLGFNGSSDLMLRRERTCVGVTSCCLERFNLEFVLSTADYSKLQDLLSIPSSYVVVTYLDLH